MSYMLILSVDNMAFSLPFCLGEAGFDGIVAGSPGCPC